MPRTVLLSNKQRISFSDSRSFSLYSFWENRSTTISGPDCPLREIATHRLKWLPLMNGWYQCCYDSHWLCRLKDRTVQLASPSKPCEYQKIICERKSPRRDDEYNKTVERRLKAFIYTAGNRVKGIQFCGLPIKKGNVPQILGRNETTLRTFSRKKGGNGPDAIPGPYFVPSTGPISRR